MAGGQIPGGGLVWGRGAPPSRANSQRAHTRVKKRGATPPPQTLGAALEEDPRNSTLNAGAALEKPTPQKPGPGGNRQNRGHHGQHPPSRAGGDASGLKLCAPPAYSRGSLGTAPPSLQTRGALLRPSLTTLTSKGTLSSDRGLTARASGSRQPHLPVATETAPARLLLLPRARKGPHSHESLFWQRLESSVTGVCGGGNGEGPWCRPTSTAPGRTSGAFLTYCIRLREQAPTNPKAISQAVDNKTPAHPHPPSLCPLPNSPPAPPGLPSLPCGSRRQPWGAEQGPVM